MDPEVLSLQNGLLSEANADPLFASEILIYHFALLAYVLLVVECL